MKISIVGAGNAGCFTALHFAWRILSNKYDNVELELIYDPEISPEPVGQATVLEPPGLLWAATGFNWYKNPIHATFKTGILYKNWGKINEEFFHAFPADRFAMHYCPWEMQKSILDSGLFNVKKAKILDTDEIDSDYIIDCRGKPKSYSGYRKLKNPINSCILGSPKWDLSNEHWSTHTATLDGWAFTIPTSKESPSYKYCIGYCYNNNITTKEESTNNFSNLFNVEVSKHISFENYVASNPMRDARTFLNGNRLFFLEPLESSSTQIYLNVAKFAWDVIFSDSSPKNFAPKVFHEISKIENFILWHYQFGSKYDTPFWNYAKSLKMNEDAEFKDFLNYAKMTNKHEIIPGLYGGRTEDISYAQWPPFSFKTWYDGMTQELRYSSSS
tara:strand:- start:685 stop:1845 length:1161 start_codon:yes stop_codon:yes gene_type:complete